MRLRGESLILAGRLNWRLMTSLKAASGVLGWGEPAVLQPRAAARVTWTR